ncbi:MAG: hypothetical protein L3K19_03280 [Thermoplasmata archaeon]|nr:hypothetical protein [Thermoplasmata archaeon]
MKLVDTLSYSTCGHCGHEVATRSTTPGPHWVHHITRSRLYHLPHWPTGHILTLGCRRGSCDCVTPTPVPNLPVRVRWALIGANTTP